MSIELILTRVQMGHWWRWNQACTLKPGGAEVQYVVVKGVCFSRSVTVFLRLGNALEEASRHSGSVMDSCSASSGSLQTH